MHNTEAKIDRWEHFTQDERKRIHEGLQLLLKQITKKKAIMKGPVLGMLYKKYLDEISGLINES